MRRIEPRKPGDIGRRRAHTWHRSQLRGVHRVLGAVERRKLQQIKSVKLFLDRYERMLNEAGLEQGMWSAKTVGNLRGLMALIGIPEAEGRVSTFRTGTRSLIARVFGEVGNLNETEQKAAAALLPFFDDSSESAKIQMNELRGQIADMEATILGEAGINTVDGELVNPSGLPVIPGLSP